MQNQDELSGEASRTDAAHHLHSSLREKIVEHVFVGEALRALWRRGVFDVRILRCEFDADGYDLLMERGKIVRHIASLIRGLACPQSTPDVKDANNGGVANGRSPRYRLTIQTRPAL